MSTLVILLSISAILLSIFAILLLVSDDETAPTPEDGYEPYNITNPDHFSVLTLNTWAIPGAPDIQERMDVIGGHIANGQYDLVLLTELWTKTNHDIIRMSLPHGYKMTSFHQLNGELCIGAIANVLAGCSGLAVISRLPMANIGFTPFRNTRSFFSNFFYAKRGIGSVILTLHNGLKLQVLITHTESENNDVRDNQVDEFIEDVKKSKTTFVIGGGDLNLGPASAAYSKLNAAMVNAFGEVYPNSWNTSQFSTYGHSNNTFTSEAKDELLDYILYYIPDDSEGAVGIKTCWLPLLTAIRLTDRSVMSVSDHEGIACTFVLMDKWNHSGSEWENFAM